MQAEVLERVAQFARGRLDLRPADAGIRVEVEDQRGPVSPACLTCEPQGWNSRTFICASDSSAGEIVDPGVFRQLAVVLGDLLAMDRAAEPGPEVFLEEALALDAVRAAHDGQQPVARVLQQAFGDGGVVLEHLAAW